MNTFVRRTTTVLTAGAALLVAAPGVAVAHECMVSNQSQRAAQAVGHSPMWLSENMATRESYAFTFEVLGVEPSDEILDAAVARHEQEGLQEWAAFFQGHTLLTNPHTGAETPAGTTRSGDGRGVDHWSDTELGLAMIAIAKDLIENADA